MKNRILRTLIAGLLIILCTFSSVTSVYATDDIDKRKAETQKALDDANQKKSDAQSDVSDLEKETDQLESEYNSLYKKMSSINAQIAEANETIAGTEEEIAQLEAELEEAKRNEDMQYEAMKKRMVYFYEHKDDTNILIALFTSGSIAEFLTRANMISEIVSYDRQLLESYQELQETIAAKSESLNSKYNDLKTAKDVLNSSQGEMKALLSETSDKLSDKEKELGVAILNAEESAKAVAEIQAQMKSLEAQAAEAQAAKARELAAQLAQSNENTGGSYSADDYERVLLAATIMAEAGGESYTGQLAVGSVIMNRVKSSKFPNTISGVIMAKGQFMSYPNAVNKCMARGISESCLKAADAVLSGTRNGDWLFFMTQYYADKFGITGYTVIGNHVFFKIWGANVDTGVTETTEEAYTPTDTAPPAENTTSEENTSSTENTTSTENKTSSENTTSTENNTSTESSQNTSSSGSSKTEETNNNSEDASKSTDNTSNTNTDSNTNSGTDSTSGSKTDSTSGSGE